MENLRVFCSHGCIASEKKADVSSLCEADCEKDSILTGEKMSFF